MSQPQIQGLLASEWTAERGKKWRDQLPNMEATLSAIDAPLIAALRLDRPLRIAEIGCGGGSTALEIIRQAPAGTSVHGYDISPDLVELARTRVGADGGISFQVVDMGTAPAPAEPYDRLLSRFGIMFFEDPEKAFSNLASWLAPGGRFAFAVWGPPAHNPWMSRFRDVALQVLDVPAPDPDAPGPFRYGGGAKLLALLDTAGFGDLEMRDWRGMLPLGGGLSAPDAVEFAFRAFSVGDLLAEAGEPASSEVRRLLTERYAVHERDGAVRMDARVHVVTGCRPV